MTPSRILALLLGGVVAGCLPSLDLEELQEGCPVGEKVCANECVPTNDPAHGCGAESCAPCSVAHGRAGCTAEGRCGVVGCDERYKVCDGECVSVLSPRYGCNRVGCDPCTLPDATSACSAEGECIVAACAGRRGDCDRIPSNGCEANLNEDVANCGECGARCDPLPHAEVTCGGANCVVRQCDRGWGNCDGNQRNGCETELTTSADHCGRCGEACAVDQICLDGACT